MIAAKKIAEMLKTPKPCPQCTNGMDLAEDDVDETTSRYWWVCYWCDHEEYIGRGGVI